MKKNEKDPQEDIKKLNEVIAAGQFKHVHLLYGEEDFLRLQLRDKLLKALGAEPGSMSYSAYYGKETVPEQIIDLAETLPFFSDKRIIFLEDTGWFKSNCEVMENYISQGICDTTVMVFCEKEVDKRTKMFKTVSSAGMASEFMTQDLNSLIAWTASNVRKAGMAISAPEAKHFVEVVGSDMTRLSNELDKLVSYCIDKNTITSADIDAICSRQLEDRIFDMVDALAMRKKSRALALYYDLIARREAPIKILVLVTRQYETILKVKDLDLRRKSDNEIGSAIGKAPWTVKNYRSQGAGCGIDVLKKIVSMCADTDMNIKSGIMAENIAVETLLVKLSEGIYE